MSSLEDAYRGRRAFVTGHTGFKGAWLSEWLTNLGAQVTGYALDPPTEPNLFDAIALHTRIKHVVADVRDADRLLAFHAGLSDETVFLRFFPGCEAQAYQFAETVPQGTSMAALQGHLMRYDSSGGAMTNAASL
jgi:CDP-glucose 4,6-dehydratase